VEEFDRLPYGIIELDASGKVLAFNRFEATRSCCRPQDVIGKNFFRDIAPCTNVQEYEGRFRSFLSSDEVEEEFDFTYPFEPDTVVHIVFVKVLDSCVLIVSKEKVA
jgi:photoactive yellow protein